mmetsp:Transcript_14139/g.42675  ORF Transcript_14139/g.42675 Transcript_14139/m.42675 type:complete len:478 (+) Transcript_14139:565-1998(+)
MENKEPWLPAACFYAVSMAYTVGWTTCSSELTYYSDLYGPEVLLLMNVCYFAPSVPIMVFQNIYDEAFDKFFGVAVATGLRLVLGLGGAAVVVASFPFHKESMFVLLLAVSLLGIFSGVAFGSSYQLVSRFGERESVALTTGFVGSGPIVLLLEALLHIGTKPTFGQRVILYFATSAVILAGLAAGAVLLSKSWRDMSEAGHIESSPAQLASLPSIEIGDGRVGRRRIQRAYSRGTSMLADLSQLADLSKHDRHEHSMGELDGDSRTLRSVLVHNTSSGSVDDHGGSPTLNSPLLAREGPFRTDPVDGQQARSAARRLISIWPVAAALFFSAFTSIMLFPFFAYVPMTPYLGVMLPQMLFATRVVADIFGRISPKSAAVQTPYRVLVLSLVRVAMTPLFFWYILDPTIWSPLTTTVYVAVFWWSSGYINTIAFLMAPKLVSKSLKSRSGAVMALTFQASCLVALVAAYALQVCLRTH